MIRRITKKLKFMLGILFVSAFIACLSLCLVYLIPTENIERNVSLSAGLIEDEGTYPKLFPWCSSNLDNWTDSIMLLESTYRWNESILEKALLVKHKAIDDWSADYSLVYHYNHDYELNTIVSYPRYWHGYLVIIKPLLYFFNYNQIRLINGVLQLVLNFIIIILLYYKNMKKSIIPYLFLQGFLMPVVLAKSLQYSTCYYIFSFSVLLILVFNKKFLKNFDCIFYLLMITGVSTAFFDFLTYPIITFGIPCILYFNIKNASSIKNSIYDFTRLLISWGCGYFGMWSLKWVIGSLLTKENVILDALKTILFRTSHSNGSVSYTFLSTIKLNVCTFFNTPLTLFFIGFCCYNLYKILKKVIDKKTELNKILIMSLPYFMVSLLPFLWYLFTINHSAIHGWLFTYKALGVSLFSLLLLQVKIANIDDSAL